jgi:hypothetical protein
MISTSAANSGKVRRRLLNKVFGFRRILIMLSDLCCRALDERRVSAVATAATVIGVRRMVDVSEITLEKLCLYTDQSNTLITIDAPLFGSLMIFNGRVLHRGGSYVELEKIGTSIGFPAYEQILAEASRFWIVDENGIRRRKCRDEMAALLEQVKPRARSGHMKSANSM